MAQDLFNLNNYFPNRGGGGASLQGDPWTDFAGSVGGQQRGYPWMRAGGGRVPAPGPRGGFPQPFPGRVQPRWQPQPSAGMPMPNPAPGPRPGGGGGSPGPDTVPGPFPRPAPLPPPGQFPPRGTPPPSPFPGPSPLPPGGGGRPRPLPGPPMPPLPVPPQLPGPDQLPQMNPLDPNVLYGILSFLASHPALGQGGGMLSQYATPDVLQALARIRSQMPEAWLPQIRAQFEGSPYGGIL